MTAIKARAPVLGGNFGVWGGLFSTFDCAVKGIRKKEDPYNASMFYCHSNPVAKLRYAIPFVGLPENRNGVMIGDEADTR